MVDGMYVLEIIEDWLYENGLVLGDEITSCAIENDNVIVINSAGTFMLTVVKN